MGMSIAPKTCYQLELCTWRDHYHRVSSGESTSNEYGGDEIFESAADSAQGPP